MKTRSIEIYLDGAETASIIEMASDPFVAGFTTNPSLMKKAGVRDYAAYCKEILPKVHGKPISFEVFADDFSEMKRQAEIIRSWGKNVFVKIPVMNSKGESSAKLIRDLSLAGTPLNVTAIFSIEQTREVCAALHGGAPSLVSIFVGRLADVGIDPMPFVKESVELCRKAGPQAKLLWASTREAFNILEAERLGVDVITAPLDLIKKAKSFGSKTDFDLSKETVLTFKKDAEACGFLL